MTIQAQANLTTTGYADPTHLDTVRTALLNVSGVDQVNYISYEAVNVVLWTLTHDLPGTPVTPSTWPPYCIGVLLEHGYVTTGSFDPSTSDGQP